MSLINFVVHIFIYLNIFQYIRTETPI